MDRSVLPYFTAATAVISADSGVKSEEKFAALRSTLLPLVMLLIFPRGDGTET